MDGFINILKPPGMSSHDVVKYLRTCLSDIKIGHGGTLDPGAAGVLPVMLGRATRLSSFLTGFLKVYRAELVLGITTDTADSFGKIVQQQPVPCFDMNDIKKILNFYTGEIQQVPPMFSAVKKDGKKLYQYAREGVTVERKARRIKIFSINIVAYFPPQKILLEIKCSSGTYIRTLCSDIGNALGCGGCMSFLLRKEVGKFIIDEAYTFNDLEMFLKNGHIEDILLPLDFLFNYSTGMILERDNVRILCQGRPVPLEMISNSQLQSSPPVVDGNIFPVYTTNREFIALAIWDKDKMSNYYLKPKKVFNTTCDN